MAPLPMRFRLFGQPMLAAGKVSWTLLLERQQEAPNRREQLPFGVGA